MHVRAAEEAYCVGPEASTESYLVIENVLEAARVLKADAIHPGYGFLSENAEFAEAVAKAGYGWIGPPPSAIVQMGDKLTARQTVAAAGVPLVPGESRAMDSVEEALEVANRGFPVMLKASAGGGGKGIRLIESSDALAARSQRRSAKREAHLETTRSCGEVCLEPHHIEIQILCDSHGNAAHIGA